MPHIVQLSAPREIDLIEYEPQPLEPGTVRVDTWYSGISAGTELTEYRGTNPYMTKTWDADRRLFSEGQSQTAYPTSGWGYSEVGQVREVAGDVTGLSAGDVVFGIWGHRSEAVVASEKLTGNRIPDNVEPIHGVFARVGAIALNAVLAAEVNLGESVAVFGQGVLGLLTTRLSRLSGADVIAVDAVETRRVVAGRMGASHVVGADAPGGSGAAVRGLSGGIGVDSAIDISGSYAALHEAVRSVGPDGRVVAAGFYQGGADALRLGEEFHHNRVEIRASQIGGTPLSLGKRWNHQRLVSTFMRLVASGAVDPAPLISDVVDAGAAGEAFQRLDAGSPDTLQMVLRFDRAPTP